MSYLFKYSRNFPFLNALSAWTYVGDQNCDIQTASNAAIAELIVESETNNPTEYLDHESITWNILNSSKWKWSLQIKSINWRLMELMVTFLVEMFWSYSNKCNTPLHNFNMYRLVSSLHILLRCNKVLVSEYDTWTHTCFCTLSTIFWLLTMV